MILSSLENLSIGSSLTRRRKSAAFVEVVRPRRYEWFLAYDPTWIIARFGAKAQRAVVIDAEKSLGMLPSSSQLQDAALLRLFAKTCAILLESLTQRPRQEPASHYQMQA
jgi:hypothetical protein